MKKCLISLLIFAGLLGPVLMVPASAGAVDVSPVCKNGAAKTDYCGEAKNKDPVIGVLKVALEIVAIIVGFAAVVMLVLGGIKLTMSNGDPSAIKSGRDQILYAVIGVVVALFAQAIVSYVLTKL